MFPIQYISDRVGKIRKIVKFNLEMGNKLLPRFESPIYSALPLKVWVRECLSRADLVISAFGAGIRNKLSPRLKPSHSKRGKRP